MKMYELNCSVCGESKPENVNYLGLCEGENERILGESMIGLDFSRFPYQNHDNTKIMDYLRSGLAVICDNGTPSYRFVDETGFGYVMDVNSSIIEYKNAFMSCVEKYSYEERLRVSKYMANKYGWEAKSLLYSKIIAEVYLVNLKLNFIRIGFRKIYNKMFRRIKTILKK